MLHHCVYSDVCAILVSYSVCSSLLYSIMILLVTKLDRVGQGGMLHILYTYLCLNHTHNVMQNIPIPTMDTGAEVAKRFYKELTNMRVLCNKNQEMMHKIMCCSFQKQYALRQKGV